jgi:hypothetical protein
MKNLKCCEYGADYLMPLSHKCLLRQLECKLFAQALPILTNIEITKYKRHKYADLIFCEMTLRVLITFSDRIMTRQWRQRDS